MRNPSAVESVVRPATPATGPPAPRHHEGPAASAGSTPNLVLARVTDVLEDAILVAITGKVHAAQQAASCLLRPQRDDIVMCGESLLGMHVLHVLERSAHESATVSIPGTDRLVLEQPAIDIRADNLDASVVRARMKAEHLHLFSRLASVLTGGFDLVADRIKRIARLETTSTDDSVRTVRNTDTVRAGHILHDASEVMSLRSKVAVIDARRDVRVNGERITVG